MGVHSGHGHHGQHSLPHGVHGHGHGGFSNGYGGFYGGWNGLQQPPQPNPPPQIGLANK